MARVLAISSQTMFGPVGLSAAVPALQSCGHEVIALPTIVLSHHPGHGTPTVIPMSSHMLREMIASLRRVGALAGIDAILTGYFATAEQVEITAEFITTLTPQHILVDPVIGDHGALYVPEAVAVAIRDQLLPRATITTPNYFELTWLAGQSALSPAITTLGVAETLVTSIESADDTLTTLLATAGSEQEVHSRRREGVPHGTGDMLAGLYLAHRLQQNPATAFAKAMAGLEHVIAASEASPSLNVAAITAGHQTAG